MSSRHVGTKPDLVPTPSGSGLTEINVTPLIDVLLVLFVVFILTAGFSRHTLPVTVPTSQPNRGLSQIVLELGNDGRDRVNGQLVPRDQLADMLTGIYRERPAGILFIKTGTDRSYQDFIDAAGLARGAGVVIVAVVGGNAH